MPKIYNNVRSLSGAILTGLGAAASYIARNLKNDTERMGWLSRRYPVAPVDEIIAMSEYAMDAAAAGDEMSSVGETATPPLPEDYPLAGSKYSYLIQAGRHTASGEPSGPQFHSIIDSSVPLSMDEIKAKSQAAAQQAWDRRSHESPAAIARRTLRTIDVSVLSVWQE